MTGGVAFSHIHVGLSICLSVKVTNAGSREKHRDKDEPFEVQPPGMFGSH